MTMSKDRHFIDIAHAVAGMSKDPSTRVGAVIVTSTYEPISFGYNGFIAGCNEEYMTNERPTKYNLVIHAELNAILYAKRDLRDARIYTTHSPCSNCLKHCLQAGIRDFVFDHLGPSIKPDADQELDAVYRLLKSVDVRANSIDDVPYLDAVIEIINGGALDKAKVPQNTTS